MTELSKLIEEMEAAGEGKTPGEWKHNGDYGASAECDPNWQVFTCRKSPAESDEKRTDARFIAFAGTHWQRILEALKQAQAENERLRESKASAFLSHFEYEDWSHGDDNILRVGDHIYCNHQRPHDGYEQDFTGKIVLNHANDMPVIMCNIEFEPDGEEIGDYVDLGSTFMEGWTFARLDPADLPRQALTKENSND